MLYASEEYLDVVKSDRRSNKKSKTSSLYEVIYMKHGIMNVHEVYARNDGEASRKIKSKFGNVIISNVIIID